MVTDFLDYARRPPIERSTVRVADLLAEIAPLVATASCEVTVDCAPELEMSVDRGQVRRAVLNLAHNAVQASAAAAVVELSAGSEATTIWIAVANTGAAIEPDVAARLFEPFFTTRQKGTGLGLAFVRDIARAHRGEVVMERVGTQTRFVLRLPRFVAQGTA